MTPTRALVGAAVAVALGIGVVIVVAAVIRDEPPDPLGTLQAPVPGEVRPDYLADGTPVWVVGHDDGTVDVLSGFDPHRPFNILKSLWWCESADGFENPDHASRWDEFGFKIGGPAPTGLPRYAVERDGAEIIVGALGTPPAPDEPHVGPDEFDRRWCALPDEEGGTYHTFDDWQVWDSPTAAVDAAPDGWILLAGHLAASADDDIILCGDAACQDSVTPANLEPNDPTMEPQFGPLYGERFIAQVQDGTLVGLTRVMPADFGAPADSFGESPSP
jgi:hypothetical protein